MPKSNYAATFKGELKRFFLLAQSFYWPQTKTSFNRQFSPKSPKVGQKSGQRVQNWPNKNQVASDLLRASSNSVFRAAEGIHQLCHPTYWGNPLVDNFSIRPAEGILQFCHRSYWGNPSILSSDLLRESIRTNQLCFMSGVEVKGCVLGGLLLILSLSSSMSWYPNSESVATGSSRNGSRPLHSQGWSLESSCIIFRSASFENKLSKIIYLSAATHFPRAWSCVYGFIYWGCPAPLQYFGNKNVISTAHNFFS